MKRNVPAAICASMRVRSSRARRRLVSLGIQGSVGRKRRPPMLKSNWIPQGPTGITPPVIDLRPIDVSGMNRQRVIFRGFHWYANRLAGHGLQIFGRALLEEVSARPLLGIDHTVVDRLLLPLEQILEDELAPSAAACLH